MRPLIVAAAIVAAGFSQARAGECKLPLAVLQAPDRQGDMAEALPDSLPAFFIPKPKPSNGQPHIFLTSTTVPAPMVYGSAPGPMAGAGDKVVYKRFPVTVNGQQHELRLPATISASDLAQARARAQVTYGPETNPVIVAVDAGDAKALAAHIASGANVRDVRDKHDQKVPIVARTVETWFERLRAPAPEGRRAHDAAAFPAIVRALVRAGADVSAANPNGYTPLALIAFATEDISESPDMLAIATFLLEHGASLVRKQGNSMVGHVAMRDNAALLEILFARGKPTQADKDLALAMSADSGAFRAARVALDAGASVDFKPAIPLRCCTRSWTEALVMYSAGRREFLKALIDREVVSNFILPGGEPLLPAVMHDHAIMEGMLQLGASPNVPRRDGTTALHAAMDGPVSAAGRARSVALLLRYGAVPPASSVEGLTPLMMSTNADGATIALLMKAGDRIDTSTSDFPSPQRDEPPAGPIYWAAKKGNDALGVALVRAAAPGADGPGAIFYAASGGLPATLNALLDKSRRHIHVRDRLGDTPLTAAASGGHASTVAVLLDRGAADINEVSRIPFSSRPGLRQIFLAGHSPDRRTALMQASLAGNEEVVALLVNRGADTEREDSGGRRAVDLARHHASGEKAARIVALLECGKKP